MGHRIEGPAQGQRGGVLARQFQLHGLHGGQRFGCHRRLFHHRVEQPSAGLSLRVAKGVVGVSSRLLAPTVCQRKMDIVIVVDRSTAQIWLLCF